MSYLADKAPVTQLHKGNQILRRDFAGFAQFQQGGTQGFGEICHLADVELAIAQQMKEAAKLAEADRGSAAPKKTNPDRGDR